MLIRKQGDILAKQVNNKQVNKLAMKALIGPEQGWDEYVMREVILEEGGYTPKHRHEWPHINYVLEGSGLIYQDGEYFSIEEGDSFFIPSQAVHQFKNDAKGVLRFICIVPKRGHHQ